ncbi:DUF3854 domain-containing protein [bacterium]|nr:DUF3854 domain-containing protein [bacterium]
MIPPIEPGDNPASLTPDHRADLEKSGLTPETIAAAGLHSILDGSRIRELLGDYLSRTTANKMGACLAFPYFDAAGEPMTFTGGDGTLHPFVRLKPSVPRTDRQNKGRKIKYESPAAAPCRAYLPPGTRAALADPTIALLITEGEKKTLCADQHGFPCVGLGGVWAWQKKRDRDAAGRGTGPRELIPDLDGVAWPGRKVFLAFDSDLADKPEVQWAEYHLADVLRQCGADVRAVRLPAEADGSKNGLDDFLIRHGPEELRKLLASAVSPARPAGDDRPKIVIGTDQYRVNGEAIAALAAGANVYQRGNMLVRAVRAETDPDPHAVVRRARRWCAPCPRHCCENCSPAAPAGCLCGGNRRSPRRFPPTRRSGACPPSTSGSGGRASATSRPPSITR